MNKQSFSTNRTILIVIGVIMLAVVGWVAFTMVQGSSSDKMIQEESMMEEDKMIEEEAMMEEGDYGKVISGKSSPFVEFTKAGYDKAISDGKIVFLDFYANWCPICRAEAPIIDSGFNGLTSDQVIGFRVNFNDPETDADEKALASELKIPYQHTKVILVDGKEVFRSTDQWKKEDFDSAMQQVL